MKILKKFGEEKKRKGGKAEVNNFFTLTHYKLLNMKYHNSNVGPFPLPLFFQVKAF